MHRAILCLFAVALTLSAACRKPANRETSSSGASPSVPADAPKQEFLPTPALPPGSPAAQAQNEMDRKLASGNVQLQVQVLDDILQAWVMSKGTPPASLDEFVKAKMLVKLPAAPAGKKFAIDPKTQRVTVMNQ